MSSYAQTLVIILFFASTTILALLEATASGSTTTQSTYASSSPDSATSCDVADELINIYKELIALRAALNQTDSKVGNITTSLLNDNRHRLATGEGNVTEQRDYGLSEVVQQACRAMGSRVSGELSSAFRRSLKTMQEVNHYQSPTFRGLPSRNTYQDCQDAFTRGEATNGVYTIRREGRPSFRAWCDFDSNGGWTVIQRRFDGSVGFSRSLDEYTRGFGSLWGEHWLGLDAIHLLARSFVRLSVYLEDHTHQYYWVNYSDFRIADAGDHYRLSVGGFVGTVFDSLAAHNGSQFSTWDSDRDASSRNCAADYYGGWWYAKCYTANLNGRYDATGNNTASTLWKLPPYARIVASVMRISSQL